MKRQPPFPIATSTTACLRLERNDTECRPVPSVPDDRKDRHVESSYRAYGGDAREEAIDGLWESFRHAHHSGCCFSIIELRQASCADDGWEDTPTTLAVALSGRAQGLLMETVAEISQCMEAGDEVKQSALGDLHESWLLLSTARDLIRESVIIGSR